MWENGACLEGVAGRGPPPGRTLGTCGRAETSSVMKLAPRPVELWNPDIVNDGGTGQPFGKESRTCFFGQINSIYVNYLNFKNPLSYLKKVSVSVS